jgi:regulator of sigma E protease
VNVLDNSRAALATMKSGDRIVAIGGTSVQDWEQMARAISQHPGQSLSVVVERDGERVALDVTPTSEGGKGKIGVAWKGKWRTISLGPKDAAVLALTAPAEVVENLVVSLGELITGKAEGELSGPAGIVKQTAEAAHRGWTKLLWLLGVLSAYLGAFNLIPFPALDGGRLMFLTYEATTQRRANARIEAHIHLIGLAMMLGLMVYVTVVNDLRVTGKPPAPSESSPLPAPSVPSSGR